MINFWVSVLALSILLYVLLDGFDLGIGILYGFAREDRTRRAMMSAVAPVWDGNETWLVVSGSGKPPLASRGRPPYAPTPRRDNDLGTHLSLRPPFPMPDGRRER
jgi:hypothetical protein